METGKLPTPEEVLVSPIFKWAVTGATPFNLILRLYEQGLVDASRVNLTVSKEIRKREFNTALENLAALSPMTH